MDLNTIESLFKEIDYLKNKAKLFDAIMQYYDGDKMVFDIPDKWKNENQVSKEHRRQFPNSPRHDINRRIQDLLPGDESYKYVNPDEVFRTLAD